jgi:hypothetical protein
MTSEVRELNKECSIFYNAGDISPSIRSSINEYTHLEVESLPSGGWGYYHFPITARYSRTLGCDILGMTGKFHGFWGDFGGLKNTAALEYECFTSLSLGGKCGIGDQLHPSGEMNTATYELVGSVYKSVSEKEEWCDDVTPLVEVAVYMQDTMSKGNTRIDGSQRGAYRMLEEAHYQFDYIDCESDFSRYKVIIFPDKVRFSDDLSQKVKFYLDAGGKVILSYVSGLGTDSDDFVLSEFGVKYVGEADYSPDYIVVENVVSEDIPFSEHVMYDRGAKVQSLPGSEILAQIWNPYFDRTFEHFCSHIYTPVEKKSDYLGIVRNGNVAYFAHPIFGMYQRYGSKVYRQMVVNCLKLLLDGKIVETDAPSTAHFTVNYQENKKRYVLHILHYIPERRSDDIDTIEDVIPLYGIRVSVKLPEQPRRAYLAPSREEIELSIANGCVSVTVPKVSGHQMVVFDVE